MVRLAGTMNLSQELKFHEELFKLNVKKEICFGLPCDTPDDFFDTREFLPSLSFYVWV